MSSSSSPTTTLPPSQPRPFSPDTYTSLLTNLTPHPPTVLEIEILPSSFSPTILTSGPSIGIPKPILISAFIHARQTLLSYLTQSPLLRENDIQATNQSREGENGDGKGKREGKIIVSQEEALNATLVILLFDAGYISATNLRKRWLLDLQDSSLDKDDPGLQQQQQSRKNRLEEAIHKELLWLESLLTSPLFRHAKSSTLWAHRSWILRTFPSLSTGEMIDDDVVVKGDATGGGGGGGGGSRARWCAFVGQELEVVMKAAEKHPGNYHAWNYARDVIRSFSPFETKNGCEEGDWKSWVETVQRWCFGHPRDISGWTFLSFLLDQYMRFTDLGRSDIIIDVFCKTQEFKRNLNWEGESVEWFLRSASSLRMNIDNG